MEQHNAKSGFYSAILFLVWPLLALASAFRNYKSHWAKNMLWAFVAFYGFCFAIGAENSGADIVRYVAQYQELHDVNMTFATAQRYFIESGEIDIARTVIAIILSRFTDSQSVLTLVYGIIFGFFFSRNMWYVLEHFKGKIRPITILLFICFSLIVPIWNINGFRMWTAAHIFIYGLLPFLFEGKRGGVIISSLAILMHYAFIVPVGILYMYLLLGNRMMIYFVFFLCILHYYYSPHLPISCVICLFPFITYQLLLFTSHLPPNFFTSSLSPYGTFKYILLPFSLSSFFFQYKMLWLL